MSTSTNILRFRNSGILAMVLMLQLYMPGSSMAAVDRNCVNNASRDLSNELNRAYDEYSEEIQQLNQRLADNNRRAYDNTDYGQQQNLVNQARQEYSYGQNEANRRLGSKVYQAWNAYYSRQSSCDPSAPTNTYYQQDPYTNYQYHNAPSYNSQYQQYPYNTSYPYNYYQQYNYGSQYNPYQYGGYYQQYSYPNDYNYQQSPYGSYSGVQYNSNYGVQYNGNGQYICPQVVMTTLPAGCGYDCTLDSSGCRRCEISCRRSADRDRSCGCANSLRPVCGRDGVTYTNECFADCAGVEVRKLNVCS